MHKSPKAIVAGWVVLDAPAVELVDINPSNFATIQGDMPTGCAANFVNSVAAGQQNLYNTYRNIKYVEMALFLYHWMMADLGDMSPLDA